MRVFDPLQDDSDGQEWPNIFCFSFHMTFRMMVIPNYTIVDNVIILLLFLF